MHRQFGHPSYDRPKLLLEDANLWKPEYKEDFQYVHKRCKESGLCRFKDKIARPVVSLPMARDFLHMVAIDLKHWHGQWILHMIDMWSRFTVSVFVPRKRPTDIVNAILLHWVGIFGIMKCVLSDNGGEFVNEELREVQSILNVETLSTAAESPFQNGICERNHQVVDWILEKLPSAPIWRC